MTSYNREKYISEAIESVLNQTFKDFKLIIVDDFSEDKSREIITKYKAKDNRIKIIFHKENKGIAKSTNDGLDIANGKFIAFIDSDDVWHTEKLEKQLQILKNNDNFIIWTNGVIIDQNSKPTGKTFVERNNSLNRKKMGDIFFELLRGNFINKSSLIFKKQNLGNIKFNENFIRLDDYQIVVDLAKKFKYFFINEPLTSIRIHANQSLANIRKSIIFLDYIRLYKYFLRKYGPQIPTAIRMFIYRKIISISVSLSMLIPTKSNYNNDFKIDPFNFIYKIKNRIETDKRIGNSLLNWQKYSIYQYLNILFSQSFKKFLLGFSIIIRLKRIGKSPIFWINFLIFLFIKRLQIIRNFDQLRKKK